ncbi:MAG: dockerin type I domain-containing protein, partial [Myxococcota bacterium]
EMIVVDSGLGIIARVELETGEFLGEQFVHEQMGMPTAVEFVDGLAVVADAEMGVFVFGAENGQFLGSFGDGQMMASDLAFADEGSFYASGYNGDLGSVQKWNAYSGELEIEFRDPAMSSAGCMLKRSDDSLLVADEVSAKIHIFDADGTYNGYFGSGEGDESSDIPNVTDMVLSPDGTIYIVTDGGLARYSQGGTFKDEYPMNDESGEDVELSKLLLADPDPVPWRPGDIDRDGRVTGADLGLMLAAWGPAARGSDADINKDGLVSGADLGQLLANWTG